MLRSALLLSAVLLAAPALAQQPRQQPTITQNPAAAAAGTYALDKSHASVVAKLSHMGLSNYTLRFNRLDGTLTYDPKNLARSRVTFTVDPGSVDTGNEAFNTELGGARFLNGPSGLARFVSTSLTATGARTGRLDGNLTLNGVTRPQSFTVVFNGGGKNFSGKNSVGFSAEGVIKRSDYRVAAGLPAAVVGDQVRLLIEAEFNQG